MKVVIIPHLEYKIYYGVSKNEKDFQSKDSLATSERFNRHSSGIFLRKKITKLRGSILAHEIMHCLQWMCQDRKIKMEEETEHMGYLMQYIFNTMCGYSYDIKS